MAATVSQFKITKYFAIVKNSSLIFILIIGIFFALRLPFLSKEYAPEETAWVSAGESVAKTGFLWVYEGENGDRWAYWKTPGFPITLGLAYKLFGSHEWVSRSVGMLFAFGQIILIYFLSKNMFGPKKGTVIGLIAAFLAATNPFSIQNSVQTDIDGGPVAFFTLLMVFIAWKIFKQQTLQPRNLIGLIAASATALFYRLDTPMMITAAIIISFLIYKRRDIFKITMAFSAALLLAIILTFGYYGVFEQTEKALAIFGNITNFIKGRAVAVNTPVSNTYIDEIASKIPFLSSFPYLRLLIPSSAFLVSASIWITLPLSFLLIFALGQLRNWRLKPEMIFLLLPALTVFLFFTAAGAGANFPRYIQSGMNLIYIFLAVFITQIFQNRKIKIAPIIAIIAAWLLFFYFSLGRELIFAERPESNQITAGIAVLTISITAVLSTWLIKKENFRFWLANAIIGAYLASLSYLLIHDLKAPYSLTNYYGNYGYKEAAQFLKQTVQSQEKIMTNDNIGYYYGGKYYNVFAWNEDEDPDMTYIAAYKKIFKRKSGLSDKKELIASFGTIDIYKK